MENVEVNKFIRINYTLNNRNQVYSLLSLFSIVHLLQRQLMGSMSDAEYNRSNNTVLGNQTFSNLK